MSDSNIPNLKPLRITAGFTQEELATAIGVNVRTVQRWEGGKQDPNLSDLRRLASLLKVTVAYLIGEPE